MKNRLFRPIMRGTIGLLYIFFHFAGNAQSPVYTNVAQQLNINHTYTGTYFGGGISFCDFDSDGLDNISLPTGPGENPQFFAPDGTPSSVENLLATAETVAIIWADYDNDGDRDAFVANDNAPSILYRNDGNLIFTDISSTAGLIDTSYPITGACWGDYDKNGFLDLFAYQRDTLGINPNLLYHNNGNGTFAEIGAAAGVSLSTFAFAAAFFDYDGDGWEDLYVVNDKVSDANQLFHNNGDGTFTDLAATAGANIAIDGMGIAIGDYDNNGYFDVYMSNTPMVGNVLLQNNGDGTFSDISVAAGVTVNDICWGVNFWMPTTMATLTFLPPLWMLPIACS